MLALGLAATLALGVFVAWLLRKSVYHPRIFTMQDLISISHPNEVSVYHAGIKIKPVVYLYPSGPSVYDAQTGKPLVLDDGEWKIKMANGKAVISCEVKAMSELARSAATETAKETVEK